MSWQPDLSAVAVDAFLFPLRGENPYCFLLVSCIPQLLQEVLQQQVTITLAGSMEARPQKASTRISSPATDRLNQRHWCNPPSLKSDMLQDLRLILEAISHPQGFINSVVRVSLTDYNSHWQKYKWWCLEEGLHPWLSFDHT